MRKSISTRILYSTTAILFCGLLLMGIVYSYLTINYFQEERNQSLSHTINNIMRIVEEYTPITIRDNLDEDENLHIFENLAVAREIMITARATGDLIFVTSTDGAVMISNDMSSSNAFLGLKFPEEVLDSTIENGNFSDLGSLNNFSENMYFWSGRPIYDGNNNHTGFIFAASDASSLYEYVASTLSMFFISAGLMLIVASVFSIWMTARITTPLREMADAAKKFGSGDFSVRIEEDGEDEIVQLSHSFNAMAESLQKIDSSRASFMGDIAHELRTPMTSIKGFVDGMLDGTIPEESTKHYLGIVSQESARLTRLIKNMLDITKLEAGEYVVNAQYYDIWENITSIVFAAEQRISSGDVKLCGFTPKRTIVYADPDLIHQVIYNIFDNALKFCPEGGEICFNVKEEKSKITVSIKNTGDGIEKDALPYVFDRFYKEDKSRGINTGGSGLGLHICKVLITLLGGEIWVESNPGVDCTFSFSLLKTAPNGQTPASTSEKVHGASLKLPKAHVDIDAVEIVCDDEKTL